MEEDVKLKILFNKQALVVYCQASLKLDVFYGKLREACKLPPNQPITAKWIDNEGMKKNIHSIFTKKFSRRPLHNFIST